MKTTTHKIWRYRKWLKHMDINVPFSSVIITSYQLFLDRPKDGIYSSSSEPLSWVGVNNKGVWQRLSFLVKHLAEFLLYHFFFTIFLLLFCIWDSGRQNQLMYTLALLLLLTAFSFDQWCQKNVKCYSDIFFQILRKISLKCFLSNTLFCWKNAVMNLVAVIRKHVWKDRIK